VKLLADTGALIALFNPRDALHERAKRFARDATGTRFVLTDALDGSFTFDRNFRDCGIAVYPDS